MEDKKLLLANISKVHTTELGTNRIKKNLKIDTEDVVGYCINKILDKNCNIYQQGKNWYCEVENMKITINSQSYTIITAHSFLKKGWSNTLEKRYGIMSIYCEKVSELFGLPGNKIVQRIEKFTSDTSITEKKSWGGIIA